MRRLRAAEPSTARTSESLPTVSVVVPCYNYGRYLPYAVRSALDQPGVDVEVIVVDDASTDGSAEVAESLAAEDDRVVVVRHRVNLRHIATYNDGLFRARGTYVVLLSADDMLSEGSLARSVALFEAWPGLALVYGGVVTFTDRPPMPATAVRNWSVFDGAEWIARLCMRGSNLIVNPEAVMRTSVLRELGGYDASFPQAADMLLWMRAATRGGVGRVNGPDQAFYRVHGENMHLTDFGGHLLTEARERRAVFERFFETDGRCLHRADALRDRALHSIGRDALRSAALVGHTDGGSTIESQRLVDFALECAPTLRRRHEGKARRRSAGHVARLDHAVAVAAHRVRWSLRWRRWRRYGT
ncbi:glycosyltransferase [Rhodococcus kroppenstedtii]|uniref:glycosyltransferase family 2 protein n=1 Tax=Rhodococcoides kroppenstedtii TaxID=293050 RepID=UPI001C9B780C|nr:glycosyltransferase [Rhodococcus kroppenstedtii]MBY6436599.1 glycosyltransferase [Rhodococcus kroppenstedtii]